MFLELFQLTKMIICITNFFEFDQQLIYTEFPFESEAKGDSLVDMHRTKVAKV